MTIFTNEKFPFRPVPTYTWITLLSSTLFHRILYEVAYRYIAPHFPKQKIKQQQQPSSTKKSSSKNNSTNNNNNNNNNSTDNWYMLLSSYLVSTIHAFFSLSLAIYVCVGETQFSDLCQSLSGRSFVTSWSIAWSLGYYFYDLQMVIQKYPKLGETPVILHHVMYMLGAFSIILYDYAHFILVLFNLTEASTPFVNLRWFLSESGLDAHYGTLYAVNGIAMWLMFGICRIYTCLWIFPVYIWYGQWSTVVSFPYFMIFFSMLLVGGISVLNLFWYYKITMGLVKVVSGLVFGGSSSSSSATNGAKSDVDEKSNGEKMAQKSQQQHHGGSSIASGSSSMAVGGNGMVDKMKNQ